MASRGKSAKPAGNRSGPGKSAKGKSDGDGARQWRKRAGRWLRRLAIVLAVLILVPPVLTIVYRLDFIRPVSTLMLRDTVTFSHRERDWVEFDAVAPALVRSVLMSEDGQFCRHHGVDWGAVNEVIDDAMDGGPLRGASTITMQTAKNLFLWNGRSYLRKALEVPLAIWIDLILPKERIMEIYLNIAEWGDGIYGIEAASWTYFGRPASELTTQQAALLAVTLPNPYVRDPVNPGPRLSRLANVIRGRADKAGSHDDCLYQSGIRSD